MKLSDLSRATDTRLGKVEKATTTEAEAGTVDKYPDAAGVHAAFNQFGLGDSHKSISVPALSSSGARRWEHIGYVDGVGSSNGDSLTFLITGAGFYAYRSRSSILVTASERADALQIESTYLQKTNGSPKLGIYYRRTSNNRFEIWIYRGDYCGATGYIQLGKGRFTQSEINLITTESVEPTGLTEVSIKEMYHQSNILGTVSQSAGVPTGAIIEAGSNANGNYTKWADGTMICTTVITGGATDIVEGVLYRSAIKIWTYPVAFSVVPVVSGDCVFVNRFVTTSGAEANHNTSSVDIAFLSAASSTTTTPGAKLSAIGRWY